MAVMSAVMSEVKAEEVARCPHCGSVQGGTAAALDALYREVQRLTELAGTREAELLREIRLLQETVARLRGSEAPMAPRRDRYVTDT